MITFNVSEILELRDNQKIDLEIVINHLIEVEDFPIDIVKEIGHYCFQIKLRRLY
ncbi:hypothetical protein SAMN04487866_1168 [Thermoactinomyces sp. DSM 45891]|nr:hypothetical protein SAMN04487866_1168 [Thermoactinomyces sp. DSM 45891]